MSAMAMARCPRLLHGRALHASRSPVVAKNCSFPAMTSEFHCFSHDACYRVRLFQELEHNGLGPQRRGAISDSYGIRVDTSGHVDSRSCIYSG